MLQFLPTLKISPFHIRVSWVSCCLLTISIAECDLFAGFLGLANEEVTLPVPADTKLLPTPKIASAKVVTPALIPCFAKSETVPRVK